MIRVGIGKPGLNKHYADSHHMHHDPNPLYSGNGWFWVSLEQWMDIQNHQTFKYPEGVKSVEQFQTEYPWIYARLQGLIKQAMGTVWQRNGLAPNKKDHYRYCTVLGQEGIVQWSWIDAYIRKPYYDFLARVMNCGNKPIRSFQRF